MRSCWVLDVWQADLLGSSGSCWLLWCYWSCLSSFVCLTLLLGGPNCFFVRNSHRWEITSCWGSRLDLHSLCVCGGPKRVKRCVFWNSINSMFRAPWTSSWKFSNPRIFIFESPDPKVYFAWISMKKGDLEI